VGGEEIPVDARLLKQSMNHDHGALHAVSVCREIGVGLPGKVQRDDLMVQAKQRLTDGNNCVGYDNCRRDSE